MISNKISFSYLYSVLKCWPLKDLAGHGLEEFTSEAFLDDRGVGTTESRDSDEIHPQATCDTHPRRVQAHGRQGYRRLRLVFSCRHFFPEAILVREMLLTFLMTRRRTRYLHGERLVEETEDRVLFALDDDRLPV